jgi:hypothetical protein
MPRIALIVALLVPLGAVRAIQQPAETPSKPGRELARGQTVILGTYRWDIETNKQEPRPGLDVWWEQFRSGDQYLTPMAGASLFVVENADFDKLTRDDLAKLKFGHDRLSNAVLLVNVVVAVRTVEGNLAKLKVIGYRDSHDLSFEEAKLIPPNHPTRTGPNIPKRHLEVSWVLYEKIGPAR